MSDIAEMKALCQRYTSLTDEDLEELCRAVDHIEDGQHYGRSDVFIDVYNELSHEALVVYHRKPYKSSSLYEDTVVGKDANLKKEPGVMRTLETSLNTIGLLALTQENKPVKQDVYPIRNDRRTIGVIIVETGIQLPEEIDEHMSETQQQGLPAINLFLPLEETVADELPEALLVFDKYGRLKMINQMALKIYEKLGYRNQLIGMHYDNLTLDGFTFEYALYKLKIENSANLLESDTKYQDYYFHTKTLWLNEEQNMVVIIHDNTELKKKEEELVSYAVVIREIHHRIKNNLQSIVSLLRIQERRTESPETKKVLNETTSRIMAIAATHELLSKQMDDEVSLKQTLETITRNFKNIFRDTRPIELTLEVPEGISIQSDQMVTISLIVNELVQNTYDHAFADGRSGTVAIVASEQNGIITILVTDDGQGYDPKKVGKNSLGLMIVHSYVKEKLKGKLTIKSGKNGTTTSFSFEKNFNDVVR